MELADEKAVLEQVHADVDAVAGLVKENKKLAGNKRRAEPMGMCRSCLNGS